MIIAFWAQPRSHWLEDLIHAGDTYGFTVVEKESAQEAASAGHREFPPKFVMAQVAWRNENSQYLPQNRPFQLTGKVVQGQEVVWPLP